MKLNSFGKEYTVRLRKDKYYNDNLCIIIFANNEDYGCLERFAKLTVNLVDDLPPNMGYVDVNNIPDAERFIKEYNIGKPLGKTYSSGFCTYPLYEFNITDETNNGIWI